MKKELTNVESLYKEKITNYLLKNDLIAYFDRYEKLIYGMVIGLF